VPLSHAFTEPFLFQPILDELLRDPTDPSILDPLKDELMTTTRRANEVRNKADRMVRESQLVEDDAMTLKMMTDELNINEVDSIARGEISF
jgi:hypothetical protein